MALFGINIKSSPDRTPPNNDKRHPVQGRNRESLKERGPGAWQPPLFAANKGACLRTAPIAPPGRRGSHRGSLPSHLQRSMPVDSHPPGC